MVKVEKYEKLNKPGLWFVCSEQPATELKQYVYDFAVESGLPIVVYSDIPKKEIQNAVINRVKTKYLENAKDKHINNHVAEKACLEVTKLIKVLKAHYTSHEYVDEDNEDKLVKYNILLFNFETYCYNMYDFSKLFYDGINVILGGYQEYHKLYDEIWATLPSAPIGFRAFESNVTNDNSQTINGHRIGFV